MKKVSLSPTITVLDELFQTLNNKYFEGELVKPVISVAPDMTSGSYGWCSTVQFWGDKENEAGHFELNVTAEHLNRADTEIVATLLHEMVHLYNIQNGVQDCSRGNTYHNKKFKDEAERRGLAIDKSEKYGWTITSLQPETTEFVNSMGGIDFQLWRLTNKKLAEDNPKKKKKSSSRKYECPTCGQSVRATKEVNIICADCTDLMIEV